MGGRIIIVGGGFAGVKCARTLRKLLPPEWELVLFNRENHMVFHPLLAEVVSATVQPKDVGAPLRQLLRGVICRAEEVTNILPEGKRLFYEGYDGQVRPMHYDHLVLTCGNTVNLSLIQGMDEHAFPLKTLGDALALQSHIMEQLEKAEVCENAAIRASYLTFLVVGGGFSGVEVAGEINDLVKSSARYFHNFQASDIKVVIVHSGKAILPEVGENLRQFARREMEKAGVEVKLEAAAAKATKEGLRLTDGSLMKAATVVCTIGTTSVPLIAKLNLPKNRGRLVTQPDMSIEGMPGLWALGDCGAVINSLDGNLCPPVAQFAERQGYQAAKNIVASIHGLKTAPFRYKMQGQLCSIGGRSAVAEIMGLKLSGRFAWFLWRGIYLMKLPSFTQKVKVGIEWACDLLFGRTLAHLKADRTRRVGRAYFGSGDIIFKQGDPATEFFVIEKGEVEIIAELTDGGSETIAILGPGDFFGESSLLERALRTRTVRARGETVCMVLGRNVFNQISAALIPLKDAVARAALRRTSMWHNVPEVRTILSRLTLTHFLEPLPMPPVSLETSVETVIADMEKFTADACYVVDKEGALAGIITRSDLLSALEKAPLADPDSDLPVTEIMVMHPVAMEADEQMTAAIATMRDHDLKQLPVIDGAATRKPLGRIKIEKVVSYVLAEMVGRQADSQETDSAENLHGKAITGVKARKTRELASHARKTLEI
ncbi:MAG: FAD-dependent oxidoreductase [Candidatus Obscuribacter sp.]|nr:FAD-dependent oxidoreductase [Candidatus Obscuribacter sp.]MBK9280018.1 FAD-dependent oxidoreductase [Candidatus Obscuribacter sp.]MBL8085112.1 FAD-dependent oxidoreductase [Candidatus Obscuribacter sp.]